jgi:hypothetical protein
MTTYRVKHNKENPYAKLDKRFLRSPNLSAKAKGILAYLLSLPSDWRVCLNHLVTVFADGEASMRSGISELKEAGYLSKAAIRDSTGQIVNWVTDVYETPHQFERATDKNGNSIVKSETRSESTSYPDVENPDVDFPHLDNRGQLINNDPLRNKFTNPPLPSQAGGEKERELGESFEPPDTETNASQDLCREQLDSNSSVAKERDLLTDSFSAAVTKLNEIIESEVIEMTDAPSTKNEESSHIEEKAPTRRYDSTLGNQPPDEPKNAEQRQFKWLSDGPWLVEGKLDFSFVTWLAQSWQRQYGGTFHQKRSDVLRHFKKDPANLAIAWEQYAGEHLSRYENAAVRMDNGLEIQPSEQQELLQNLRAVTNPLPDDLNPVVTQPCERISVLLRKNQTITTRTASAFCEDIVEDRENQPLECHSFPTRPQAGGKQDLANSHSALCTCPVDDDSNALNTNAYRQWQPQQDENEPVCTSGFKEILATYKQSLLMSSHSSNAQDKSSELQELNAWLVDPILKHEVMAKVMRSDAYRQGFRQRFTVEFDEEGKPLRIV